MRDYIHVWDLAKAHSDALAYLRLIVNPEDDEAGLRVINYPTRGIGQTTVSRLRDYAAEEGVTFFEAAINAARVRARQIQCVSRQTHLGKGVLAYVTKSDQFPGYLNVRDYVDLNDPATDSSTLRR